MNSPVPVFETLGYDVYNKEEMESLRKKLEELENKFTTLKNRVSDLEEDNRSLEKVVDDLREKIASDNLRNESEEAVNHTSLSTPKKEKKVRLFTLLTIKRSTVYIIWVNKFTQQTNVNVYIGGKLSMKISSCNTDKIQELYPNSAVILAYNATSPRFPVKEIDEMIGKLKGSKGLFEFNSKLGSCSFGT